MQKLIALARTNVLTLLAISATVVFSVATIVLADITFGQAKTGHSTNVTITELALGTPENVAVGDFLLASIAVNGGDQATITAPDGWNLILKTNNEANVALASYWKIAASAAPATSTWTVNSQTRAEGGITRYGGVNTANPINAFMGGTGRSNSPTAPTITTTVPNTQVVAVYAYPAGAGSGNHFSAPTGMTERYDTTNSPFGPSLASFDMTQTAATSTGTKVTSVTGQRDWAAQTIALRSVSPLTTGLTHYWKLDEPSGNAFDAVGSLTLTNFNNTPFVTSDIAGNAADIETANQHYFGTTNDLVTSAPSAYSACAWFNLESVPPGESANDTILISYDTNLVFQLYYFYDNGTLQLRYDHGAGDGNGRLAIHNEDLQTGTWHHTCGTWDGSNMTLYLDGSSVATQNASGIASGVTSGTQIGASFGPSGLFDGKIDEVGFWTRELSASEITQLFNGGSGLQYPF